MQDKIIPVNRRVCDRRSNDLQREAAFRVIRRHRPDRRLGGIAMERVPLEEVRIQPLTRIVFRKS
jgi:hypothetical protein